MNTKYMNYSHAPVPSPLKKPLAIELYNDTFFSPSSITNPTVNQPSSTVDSSAFMEHPTPELPPPPTNSTIITQPECPLPPADPSFHGTLCDSNDKLFFIRFTPEHTMRPRWYLIEVDLESTPFVNKNYLQDFTYWCVFQARHPSDKNLSDEYTCWWPEWHKYHRDSISGDIVFGDRILFLPSSIPPQG